MRCVTQCRDARAGPRTRAAARRGDIVRAWGTCQHLGRSQIWRLLALLGVLVTFWCACPLLRRHFLRTRTNRRREQRGSRYMCERRICRRGSVTKRGTVGTCYDFSLLRPSECGVRTWKHVRHPRRLVVEPISKVKEQVVASRTTTPQKVLKRIEQGPAADKDTSVQTTTNRTRHQKLVCADDSGFTEIGVRLAVSCSEREQSGPLANFLI